MVARPSGGINLKYVVLGVVASFVLAFVLSGVTGVIIYRGWVSEVHSPAIMSVVSFASLFFGALYTGRRAQTAGWAHGALTGLAYVATVTVIGLLVFDQLAPVLVLLERGGLAAVLGALAGTVGINLR